MLLSKFINFSVVDSVFTEQSIATNLNSAIYNEDELINECNVKQTVTSLQWDWCLIDNF